MRAAAVTRAPTRPRFARWLPSLCLLLAGLAAQAHPIVSTDINRHVSIHASDAALEIRYVYEMLEIAAVETARAWDADSDGVTSWAERDAFAQAWARDVQGALHVTLDGRNVPLTHEAVRWELGEGAFGLSTWKLTAQFSAALPVRAQTGSLSYEDTFRPGEVGWKEIVLSAGGRTDIAASSVPARDRSSELTDYEAMLAIPNPDEVRARAVLRFPWVAQVASRAPLNPTANASQAADRPADASAIRGGDGAPGDRATRYDGARGGNTTDSMEMSASDAAAAKPPMQSGSASAWDYYAWPFFRLGVHHIATGFDHLLFLLGLILLRQPMRRLVAVVTAFTFAHSLTLALAASGQLAVPGPGVEFLIAASIAYVGLLALLRPESRHGPGLALVFGLVHGVGFAGALGDALAGVHGRDWLVALLSFNLGIEALQVLLVVLVWPLLRAFDGAGWPRSMRPLLSAIVLAAGAAWMVERGLTLLA